MTNQAEPGRPPAHDLSAFDLSKRSPEQLAQSFAHWKAQRKRPPEAEATRASPPLAAQPSPAIAKDTTPDLSPGNEAPKPAPAKRSKSVQYSDTFSALLAAGSEPTVQRAWTPVAVRPSPKRNGSPGRRLKAMSALAGAASVLALAGGALLELSDWRDSTEAAPEVAQIHPQQFPMAGPIAAAATRAPAVEWKLRRTVDLALMKAAPNADAAKPMQPAPEPPTVQTASKAAIAAPPGPAHKKAAPETEQFVAKPFVPSAAPSPAVVPATQGTAAIPAPPVAAVARSGDPRPDALFQLSRDKNTSGNGGDLSNRVASDGKPAAATGSERAVDPRSATTRTATARSGKVANGSSGDPRGEVSGGASVGPDTTSASGGDDGDASGGSDTGSGNTGDDGATGGGSASSGADGGDTGSADTGGSDTGGSDAGGSDTGDSGTGSSDTGGDDAGNGAPSDAGSGDGESSSSNGEDGDSGGIGGAISGALDGAGDTLGDALGGTNGNPDSNDKDQRN